MLRYAFPYLGRKLCQEITISDVLNALKPLWYDKPVTASRLRSRIELVLAYAAAREGRTQANPAAWKGGLAAVLPSPPGYRSPPADARTPL